MQLSQTKNCQQQSQIENSLKIYTHTHTRTHNIKEMRLKSFTSITHIPVVCVCVCIVDLRSFLSFASRRSGWRDKEKNLIQLCGWECTAGCHVVNKFDERKMGDSQTLTTVIVLAQGHC